MPPTARQNPKTVIDATEAVPPSGSRPNIDEVAPLAVESDELAGADPTPVEIAERAYAFYQARGGQDGYDVDDWLAAERELRSSRRRAR